MESAILKKIYVKGLEWKFRKKNLENYIIKTINLPLQIMALQRPKIQFTQKPHVTKMSQNTLSCLLLYQLGNDFDVNLDQDQDQDQNLNENQDQHINQAKQGFVNSFDVMCC